MAVIAADASFLFSLFGNDAHTATALAWTRQAGRPIVVSALSRFEFGNAMRFAAFRKVIAPGDALQSLAAFEADLKSGHLQFARCDLETVVAQAARLSERHTVSGGHRSFDLLHVATAKVLKATTFLSFDANQCKLAAGIGLTVGP